ncbi:unnamed protein product [Lymnaea stagnalis]|uniref:Uncharacterized protein n=1 Tax=Lymnaea stagnalis TaxID=6523 RepID=A0AAV2IIA2_LYMST
MPVVIKERTSKLPVNRNTMTPKLLIKCPAKKSLVAGFLAATVLAFTGWSIQWNPNSLFVQTFMASDELQKVKLSCPGVLDRMLTGRWDLKNHSAKELEEVEIFMSKTRAYHKLPPTLQREDKKCGNINFPGTNWHGAVCNPKGDTPCCMNNFCVSKTIHECQCPECLDMRQQIHAEFATWIPADPTCQMSQFTHLKDVCRVLLNKTIYLIGDSYMRQLHMSLLTLLRHSQNRSILRDDVSQADAAKCDKYYMYFSQCRGLIIQDLMECNNTVKLFSESLWKADQANEILKHVETLLGRENAWFIFGIGFHDNLNVGAIKTKVLDPIFKLLSNSTWPKMIWLAVHAPGLLKTPLHPKQRTANILEYNTKVKAIMDRKGIPVLNFFELTKGTMSYDGSHYGKGINDVKVQILLNFLREQNYIHKINP